MCMCAKSLRLCPTLCDPMDCSPLRLLCLWDSPGTDTGMGCCVLLQGISSMQGLNLHLLCLLHYQAGSLSLRAMYDPAIPLLGIYPEKTIIEKDTCTPVFSAALFIIARMWKQPRCPLTDECIKKLWYIYTMECYSAVKKEWIWVSSTEVDEPRACYTEWSKSEREKQIYINA